MGHESTLDFLSLFPTPFVKVAQRRLLFDSQQEKTSKKRTWLNRAFFLLYTFFPLVSFDCTAVLKNLVVHFIPSKRLDIRMSIGIF